MFVLSTHTFRFTSKSQGGVTVPRTASPLLVPDDLIDDPYFQAACKSGVSIVEVKTPDPEPMKPAPLAADSETDSKPKSKK